MRIKLTVLMCILSVIFTSLPVYAFTPQSTYTYDINGEAVELQEAYEVKDVFAGIDLGIGTLSNPQSLTVDGKGNIYICDSGNGRIVVINQKQEVVRVIDRYLVDGKQEQLQYPTDVAISSKGDVYVADFKGKKIIVIDQEDKATHIVDRMDSELIGENVSFNPYKIELDRVDGLYVVSQGLTNGIAEMNLEGEVIRFIGAAKVEINAFEYLWKLIAPPEQADKLIQYIPTEYNNIYMDGDDFVYGTIATVESSSIKSLIGDSMYQVDGASIKPSSLIDTLNGMFTMFSTEATGNIKKLNILGNDIMRQRGYYAPYGEVDFYVSPTGEANSTSIEDGASLFVDVALHDNGTYTLLDSRKDRLFTYDEEGKLLYIFGGTGEAKGLFKNPTSIVYVGDEIWVLDSSKNSVTVFQPTDFALKIFDAFEAYEADNYPLAEEYWNDCVELCSNFDLGYIGIGNVKYRMGDYKEAMEAYGHAEYRDGYDAAFQLYRGELVEENFNLIFAGICILVVLIAILKKVRSKKPIQNDYTRTLRFGKFKYATYVTMHPFDGFYDLKFAGKGKYSVANTLIVLYIICRIAKRQLTSFIFNANILEDLNIITEISSIVIVILLFVVANWSITTLLDGEGSMGQIYMVTGYCLTPMIIADILYIVCSHVLGLREIAFLGMIGVIGTLWFIFIFFFGMGITHGYSIMKNILAFGITVVMMMIMIFVTLLFVVLTEKIYSFVNTIITEMIMRL